MQHGGNLLVSTGCCVCCRGLCTGKAVKPRHSGYADQHVLRVGSWHLPCKALHLFHASGYLQMTVALSNFSYVGHFTDGHITQAPHTRLCTLAHAVDAL